MGQTRLTVSRHCVTDIASGQSIHPDRLSVSDGHGKVLLDISMSGDSPIRPFLDCATPRPWFFTGSPFGGEILAFAKECGLHAGEGGGDEARR